MNQDIARTAVQAPSARAVALNPMAALGVATFAAMAILPWNLPLPAARLYSISFLLSYLGVIGLAVTDFGAVLALASHWIARRLNSTRASYWLSLAKGLVLIGLAAILLIATANGVRPALQTEMLFGLKVEPHAVILSGATPDDMDAKLAEALRPGQRIDRVELSGIGGSVEAAQRATAILKAHGATTAVAIGDCASACATMFEDFPYRYVAPAGRLGFHAYWGGSFDSAAEAQQREIDHLVARGVDPAFAHELFARSALSWPSKDALRRHQLASGCWNPTNATPAVCDGDLSLR